MGGQPRMSDIVASMTWKTATGRRTKQCEANMSANPIRVVLLVYAGVQTLDVAGPLDAFASANSARSGAYHTLTTSLNGASFASESGLRIAPDAALRDVGPIDTLIVPGGAALRRTPNT
jgi:transcriptional regulator GlxA family with amidase domain